MSEAFYVPEGDAFVPTELTRGPWSAIHQHAGPPAALLGRAIESLAPGFPVARFTMEVLRPIPLAPLRVRADGVHETRRTQLAEATLEAGGEPLIRARAWRIEGVAEETALEPLDHPGPGSASSQMFWEPAWSPSYFTATEWRQAAGTLVGLGPSAAWCRMRVPLVAGEEPSPLQRVLVAADSGNGISMVLPLDRHLFVNTDLSVHLVRPLEGEWVLLDATTRIGGGGVGLADSTIADERGYIGRGAQTLFVAPRQDRSEEAT